MPVPRLTRSVVLPVVAAFLAVLAVGLARADDPPLPLDADRAARRALAAPELKSVRGRVDGHRVVRVDSGLAGVTLFDGSRAIAKAFVPADGTTPHGTLLPRGVAPFGAKVAHAPVLLALLTVLFLLAILRVPLRAGPTASAALGAASVVPVLVLDEGYVTAGVVTAGVLLLAAVVAGLAAARVPSAERTRGEPLLDRLAAYADAAARPRLRWAPAVFMGAVMLGVTLLSDGAIDVASATMEGATRLLDGTLPYAHLSGDVTHGDTYGPLAYAAYVPVAGVWPVHDGFDDATGALVVAAACAALVACALARALPGAGHRAVLAGLSLPPVLLAVSSGTNDVLLAAAFAWALAWWALPVRASVVLAAGGAAKLVPFAVLPLLLARLRGTELVRALFGTAAVIVSSAIAVVAIGGIGGLEDMVDGVSFQLDRRAVSSWWTMLGLEGLQPLAQAAAAALVVGAALAVWRDPMLAADRRRVAALTVAVLAALQLSANYWSPLYVLWLLPPAVVALLDAPSSAARRRSLSPAPAAHRPSPG